MSSVYLQFIFNLFSLEEDEVPVLEDRSTFDAGIEDTPHSSDENETVVLEISAASETPGTSSGASTRKVRSKSKLSGTSWKVADSEVSSSHDYLGQDPIFNDDLRQPFQYVCDFLDDDIMDTIVAQSNLYAIQKNPNKPLNVDRNELEQWLGLSIYFSISKLPNIRMHWSTQLGPLREVAADVMSRNRWEEIKSKFHMVDNSILDSNPRGNRDKLFKVRPLVDKLRSKFQQIPMTQNLCVDEQLAPFKGDSSFKQYIPSKPHKYGYKFMVLADSQGMTYDFMPYTGKIDPVDDQNVPDLGASANSVLHLAQVIPTDCNHLLFFDNWFTSVPLMQHLSTRGIWCCGTVRVPRLPGIKNSKDAEKALMKKGRGSYEELRSTGEGCEVTYVKWYDTKIVNIVSTFAKANPISKVSRYDRKLKCRIDVNCPDIILQYNKSMGGVDLADCLISLYRITIRSKKYYHGTTLVMLKIIYRMGREKFDNEVHGGNDV
ncbi:piggyBac transposable element-derived protein 3-like [Macrobrachium rosenbergii]|uniref:piggyBac transposable element-derived protein 3-like n=1 Tax=Macrobrachium rosenbergii TaxID=79674 RepID=UPI0034D708AF